MHSKSLYSRSIIALAATLSILLSGCATTPPVKLAIGQTDRGVMIWLPDNFLFDFGKAELKTKEAEPYLDRVAKLLNEKTTKSIALEGHTDNVGSDNANLVLSESRAKAVRTALLSRKVAANRITLAGFGESKPIAPNDSELGRKLNRRVEVIVLDETVENLSRGEPANSFEAAFDKLRKELDQPLPKK